jgi:hypothetical protein
MKRRTKENDLSRSVAKILLEAREKAIIENRRQRIERLRVTEWKIWKRLGIIWT